MWRRITGVTIATIVGLAPIVVLPAPAMAAVPAQAPASWASEQDCEQAIQQAKRAVRATGKGGTVPCISRAPSPTAAPDATTMEDACGSSGWVVFRHTACITGQLYFLNVLRLDENGVERLVGQIPHTVQNANATAGDSNRWVHGITVRIGIPWGQGVTGTTINAFPDCGANCDRVFGSFDQGLATAGSTHGGSAQFSTTSLGFGTVWRAWSTWRVWFSNPTWSPTQSNSLPFSPPAHRCDEAIGIAGSIGCVYSEATPNHFIAKTRYPKYARHVELAINFGLPRTLTRTRISQQIDANRARACPSSQTPANGWSCDEYPFASTHEGAANPAYQYGRTFQILSWNTGAPPFICGINWLSPRRIGDAHGYSVCGIPLAENVGGGQDLGEFYRMNRVIHDDRFHVQILQ